MNTAGPIQREVEVQMRVLARTIQEIMPPEFGFAFLAFELGNARRGRMNYISNANRDDMVSALKELLANFEGRTHVAPKARQ